MRERTRLMNQADGAAAGFSGMTVAAANGTTPDHTAELSLTGERDRIADRLQDMIVRRIFAAGLGLETAAGLTSNPEIHRHIDAAVSELDQVIQDIRTAVFGKAPHPRGPGLNQKIVELTDQLATMASISISGVAASAGTADDDARPDGNQHHCPATARRDAVRLCAAPRLKK